jgi:two-component system response regulator FimZ (fimbrial Z protein)
MAVDMPLSNREVTVLRYLANGLSNKEIAEQLLLSNKTISAHKSNIYSKLGVQSIVELIDYAKAHELLLNSLPAAYLSCRECGQC